MRLIPAILLIYIVLGIQSGLSPYIAINGTAPNLVLPVVVFMSLYAQKETALMGVFLLGLMQDMLTQSPVGVHSFVYAFVAIATRLTQPAIQKEHWLTNVVVAIAGSVLYACLLFITGLRLPPRYSWETLSGMVFYTAIITVIALRVLIWSKRLFIIPQTIKSPGFPAGKA